MKLLTCLSAIIACSLLFSCKKNDDTPSPLAGAWSGKLSKGTDSPTGFFQMELHADKTVKRLDGDGDVSATGTWKLNGTEFTAQYKYLDDATIVVTLTGTYDPTTKKLSGNWKNSYDVTGLWNAQKSAN